MYSEPLVGPVEPIVGECRAGHARDAAADGKRQAVGAPGIDAGCIRPSARFSAVARTLQPPARAVQREPDKPRYTDA